MFILLNILLNLQFKETKGLKSLQVKAEAYLESKHTFVMELFLNIFNSVLFLQQEFHHRYSTRF